MRAAVTIGRSVTRRTYAEFQAHIAARATTGDLAWNNTASSGGNYRVTAAAATGTMGGSPWGGQYTGTLARAIQHSLPSEAVFNDQVAASRQMLVVRAAATSAPASGLDRNGYLSNATAGANARIDEILFWDGEDAYQMTPFTSGGPTLYTWT